MTTPAVTPQAPDPSAVPMQFKDGSQSMVPKEKVVDAMYDGGELLHPMKFPDGSQAMVPHSKLSGAMGDGGQRLDTKPIPAATWQQYVGSAFGAMDPANTPGMETGIKNAGEDVTEGLQATSAGHTIAGPAQVAGAVADVATPPVVPGAMGLQSGRWMEQQAAERAALASPKVTPTGLMKLAMNNYVKAEAASEASTAAQSKEFADATYRAAAQARAEGNNIRAKAYDLIGMAAKGKAKIAASTGAAMESSKIAAGAAVAYGAYETIAGAHEAYRMISHLFGASDEDEEK